MRTAIGLLTSLTVGLVVGGLTRPMPGSSEARPTVAPAEHAGLMPCPPCRAPGDPTFACRIVQELAVRRDVAGLADGPYRRGARRLPWPDPIPPNEHPAAVEERAREFTKRCLPPGAWSVLHCDEHPCTFAFDEHEVLTPGCADERWSTVDHSYVPSFDTRLRVLFAVDDDTPVDDLKRRRLGRTNVIVHDYIHELGRRSASGAGP